MFLNEFFVRFGSFGVVRIDAHRLHTLFECGMRRYARGQLIREHLAPAFAVLFADGTEHLQIERRQIFGRDFFCVAVVLRFAERMPVVQHKQRCFRGGIDICLPVARFAHLFVGKDFVVAGGEKFVQGNVHADADGKIANKQLVDRCEDHSVVIQQRVLYKSEFFAARRIDVDDVRKFVQHDRVQFFAREQRDLGSLQTDTDAVPLLADADAARKFQANPAPVPHLLRRAACSLIQERILFLGKKILCCVVAGKTNRPPEKRTKQQCDGNDGNRSPIDTRSADKQANAKKQGDDNELHRAGDGNEAERRAFSRAIIFFDLLLHLYAVIVRLPRRHIRKPLFVFRHKNEIQNKDTDQHSDASRRSPAPRRGFGQKYKSDRPTAQRSSDRARHGNEASQEFRRPFFHRHIPPNEISLRMRLRMQRQAQLFQFIIADRTRIVKNPAGFRVKRGRQCAQFRPPVFRTAERKHDEPAPPIPAQFPKDHAHAKQAPENGCLFAYIRCN